MIFRSDCVQSTLVDAKNLGYVQERYSWFVGTKVRFENNNYSI